MDQTVLRNLLSALETIHSVSSTNQARQQAQEYCESLKRDPLGPLYGYYLAHKDNQQPNVVRHFGLGLMEDAVRHRWSDGTLSNDVKEQIRTHAVSLATEGTLPLLSEQGFIKEKVARLVVEVAKRMWPGSWDDMDAFLRHLYYKDETGREIALLILRSLCEDVCIYDDAVAALRRKDLRAGLMIIMASEAVLKEQYPEGLKGHKNEVTLMVGESGNEGWIVRLATLLQYNLPRCQLESRTITDEKITVAALKTLASSLDWAIPSSVSSSSVVPLVCQSLLCPSEKIRLVGAECYDVLASRNMTEAEREKIIWPLLDEGGLDLISRAYLEYSTVMVQGEAYEFLQKLVQATINLGEQQLCARRSAYVPKDLQKLLQLIYAMTSHPSVLISSTASFFWTTLLRHETFSNNAQVLAFVPPLLELFSVFLSKDSKNRWNIDPIFRHFASIDFGSTAEFLERSYQLFQRAVDVIHLGVPVVPLDAFIWIANKVTEVLALVFPDDSNVREQSEYKLFDGTLTLMEVAISSLSDIISDTTNTVSEQVLNSINSLLGILIEYNSQSPSALTRVLASFPAFTDMFKINSTHLFRCLDKLFKAVESPVPVLSTKDDARVSDRAAITLVKLGRAIPDTLYPIYGEIEAAVQRLIDQSTASQGVKKTLQSFLLVIAFNTTMPIDKALVFKKVTDPVLNIFQSQEITEAVSDPKKFMGFIGVNELHDALGRSLSIPDLGALKESIAQRRAQLSRSIEAILTFMKETINPIDNLTLDLWSSRLGLILPNLFSTILCANAICDDKLWVGFSPELSILRTMTPEEKISMVTGKSVAPPSNDLTAASDELSTTKLVLDLKIWLMVLRDQSYRVLAQASLLGSAFYETPMLQSIIETSLFGHVDFLSNRQLRLLIDHAVRPIVVNCPEQCMDSVLSHLLMVLFPYLDQRLLKDWKLASEEGLQVDEKDELEDTDVTDGIVRESMLRDLTLYTAGFMLSILDFSKQKTTAQTGNVDTATAQQKEITPLALFILSRQTTAQPVIQLVCHILTFQDTKACMRSVEVAQRIQVALVQNYPGSRIVLETFATLLLQAAMEALHDPYHQEGQEKLIQLITEVYAEVRAFSDAPKSVFHRSLGADVQRLEAFENELSVATNKTKNAIVKNFLQGIIGVAKSEWFKQKDLGDKPISSRTITGKYERPSQSALDSKDHEDIGEGLASLFDE